MATIIGDGITFDDVLLVPSYSEVIPNQVELGTELTHSIKLNIPLSIVWPLQWHARGESVSFTRT